MTVTAARLHHLALTARNLAFRASLEPLRQLDPPIVLSAHLPPAHRATTRLLDTLAAAPDIEPFVGPDQAALTAMLAQLEPL